MKKMIVVLILAAGVAAGVYYWKRGNSAKSEAPTETISRIERGSIRQTVSCTGKVVSNLDVEIKSKASGTVIKLPFDVSDRVSTGDLLVELDQVDMKRTYEQARVSLDASKARLVTAEQNLLVAERTLVTDRARAEAALTSAEMAAKDARAKADRLKKLFEKKLASQEECDTADTAAAQAQATLAGAKVKMDELKTQEQGLEVSRQSVELAQTQVRNDEILLQIADDRLKDCTVLAPKSATTQPVGRYIPPEWVVTERNVQTGMIIASGVSNVGGGTTIMTLSDLSRIFVLASVDESDIGKVAVGQPAVITVDAYPSIQFAGEVVRIATKGVNSQNVVTFEVKIEVLGAVKPRIPGKHPGGASAPASASRPVGGPEAGKGSGGQEKRPGRRPRIDQPKAAELLRAKWLAPEKKSLLKPEMTANIEMTTAERDDALLIPVEAVSRQAGLMYANVPSGDPTAAVDRRPIEVGINDGLRYELLAGLDEGNEVVVRNGQSDSRWASGGPPPPPGGSMRMMRMGSRGRR